MLHIFAYHAVVEDDLPVPDWCFLPAREFDAQMAWLASIRARVLPLDEAAAGLFERRLKSPVFAITFDDGYRNNVSTALPILQRHRFPATFFLATGRLGTDRVLWPCRILLALERTSASKLEWAGRTFNLEGGNGRQAAALRLQALVKEVNPGRPEEAVREIEAALRVPEDPVVAPSSPFAMMSPEEARAAAAGGLVRLGAHTVNHPILSSIDDDALAAEIGGSLEAVAAIAGEPCRLFAYPNGQPGDFDERAVDYLRRQGVDWAVTTVIGSNTARSDRFRLARWSVGATARSGARFRHLTRGMSRVPALVNLFANLWGLPRGWLL